MLLHITNITEDLGGGKQRVIASHAAASAEDSASAARILVAALAPFHAVTTETLEAEETEMLIMGEIHTPHASWHLGWTRENELPEAFGKAWHDVKEILAHFKTPHQGAGNTGEIQFRLKSEKVGTLKSRPFGA